MHSTELRSTTIPTTRFGDGYDTSEVDAFLERCASTLETLERGGRLEGVTPDEIAHVQFRATRFREGYVAAVVDDLLDVIAASVRAQLGG